jgi:hypothetical protein
MTLAEARPESISGPIAIRADDVPWNGPGNRVGIDIKDMPFFDAARGITLRASVAITRAGAYSPRHHHAFSQVRYFITGHTRFGKETFGPGDCIYFPEGAFYGPQTGDEDCFHIALQFPGPTGIPYPSPEDQRRAVRELSKAGTFEKGVFKRDGKNQDSFEAMLEFLTGRPVEYPKPRSPQMVPLHTAHYRWVPLDGVPGVSVKHLAYFNEVGPNIKLVKLEPGASTPPGTSACQQLRLVVDGSATYAGEEFPTVSCFCFPAGDRYAATASDTGATLLVVQLASPEGDPPPFCAI